ncbi:uncharacterized protein LOC112685095 [Sipha flava]|jgi:hypothetical protein|uniref:Uncharacterized protein LOC112685095 n=1 Tax=Sipha flava TaxID=143950 RepID=A0A8B8FQM4_9HEMI|nr:uncharacterized protein LOC112685095 [Sipha flava]
MQCVLEYCISFADRARKRSSPTGPISHSKHNQVLQRTIKYTQKRHFSDIHIQIQKSKDIVPTTMAQLVPFIDQTGMIRVGRYLKHSKLNNRMKHPILLPQQCHLTELLIRHYHQILLHSGAGITLSIISQRYWIVSGRATVCRVVNSCVPCTKYEASNPQPVMADLLVPRVTAQFPFYNIGIDYGGPLVVKESRQRGFRTYKEYLAPFVCVALKAFGNCN